MERLFTRKRIAIASGVGAVISLALFFEAFIEPEPLSFMLKLGAFFFLCLFLCHVGAAIWRGMTINTARSIDYVYLSIAAAGVFVLALNYGVRRADYLRAEQYEIYERQFGEAQSTIMRVLIVIEDTACANSVIYALREQCEQIKATDDRANSKTPLNDRYKLTVDEYLENAKKPTSSNAQVIQALERIDRGHSRLREERIKVEGALEWMSVYKPRRPDSKDFRADTLGIFHWPFILAFAFAVRLTKTTIEILDWAVKPATSLTATAADPPGPPPQIPSTPLFPA